LERLDQHHKGFGKTSTIEILNLHSSRRQTRGSKMGVVVTILAELGGEHREVFKIDQRTDGSLYVVFSGSRFPDAYITLHESGDFHVTRSEDGKKYYISLPEGQPLKTYKGCDSPNECVINRSLFNQYKRREISLVKSEVFVVNLADFETQQVGVITYLFDPHSLAQFQSLVSRYTCKQSKIIDSLLPNIGLIAHQFTPINNRPYPFSTQHP
jgi:hypothetical protein